MRRLLLATGVVAFLCVPALSYTVTYFGGQVVKWQADAATVYHDSATITGAYVGETAAALALWTNVAGSSFESGSSASKHAETIPPAVAAATPAASAPATAGATPPTTPSPMS